MKLSDDEDEYLQTAAVKSEGANVENTELKNILDILRGQIDTRVRARLDKAKDAGVSEMQKIMINFQSTLQAILQTKKDALTATKQPKTELFI